LTSLGIGLFILFSRFATVLPILLWTGAGLRTAFIASLNLSQLSEFALVVASIGVGLGHIQEGIFAVLIYTMAITSVISSYFIKYNHQIYHAFEHFLERLGLKVASASDAESLESHAYPIIIVGYHRGAKSLIEVLSQKYPNLLPKILVIDFNLEVLKELKALNIAGLFGDISHVDTLEHAHLDEAEIILSTIPDLLLKGTNNFELVKKCRNLAPQATIVATADLAEQAEQLKAAGANEVLLPYSLAGEFLADYVENIVIDGYDVPERFHVLS
jgi:hypothetical protein